MEISFLPTWVPEVTGWIVGLIAVSFAAIQAYANGFSATEKAKDNASKDLVKILQATVETLKEEMKDLQAMHLQNVQAIARLTGENDTLLKILQGRDDTYLKFQQEGFAAFKRIENNEGDIKKLIELLEKNLTK